MEFIYIPVNDLTFAQIRYDKEIMKIVSRKNDDIKKHLKKCFSKILIKDISLDELSKFCCIKIKDSFQAMRFGFLIIISEIDVSQLEFKVLLKKKYEKTLNSDENFISYLKKEILHKVFTDFLI